MERKLCRGGGKEGIGDGIRCGERRGRRGLGVRMEISRGISGASRRPGTGEAMKSVADTPQ